MSGLVIRRPSPVATLPPHCCASCRTSLTVCDACARQGRIEEATQKLAAAIKSIHPERRWSRTVNSDIMRERLSGVAWWRVTRGDKVYGKGDDFDPKHLSEAIGQWQRLVISGPDSGLGKTAIAVAIFREGLDFVQSEYVDKYSVGVGAPSWAESQRVLDQLDFYSNARFVAAIDLDDPRIMSTASRAPILVIDDAGHETKSGGFDAEKRAARMSDLLDRRERSSRAKTIVTTFGNSEQWESWYGGRIVRQWWQMPTATVLEMRRTA